MVKGDSKLLLGKQLRDCPAGTVYRIPSTGLTAHTNINLGDEPVQMIHMMKAVPGETKEFAMLDPNMYDPKTEPDNDMFMGNWRNSVPRLMHGSLVFRDMLTALEGPDDPSPDTPAALFFSIPMRLATRLLSPAQLPARFPASSKMSSRCFLSIPEKA